MPTASKTAPQPDPDPAPDTAAAAAPEPSPGAAAVPGGPGGAYQFTGLLPTQYLHVPLTARPAAEAVAGTDADPGSPARPATVFDWPDGPPQDGRWTRTRLKPNQAADNAAPLVSEE